MPRFCTTKDAVGHSLISGQRSNDQIKETIKQGGKLITGGKKPIELNQGWYFEPTIIACDNHNLPAAENELFGPVLSVMKFSDENEAIKLMNDNSYGLAAGVFTENSGTALRVSKAVRAGIVFVNNLVFVQQRVSIYLIYKFIFLKNTR